MLVASPEYRAADGTEDMRLSSSLLLCTLSIEEKKTESECVLKSFTPLCVCVCVYLTLQLRRLFCVLRLQCFRKLTVQRFGRLRLTVLFVFTLKDSENINEVHVVSLLPETQSQTSQTCRADINTYVALQLLLLFDPQCLHSLRQS